MKIGAQHLTYCTNIHPAQTWPEVAAALSTYVPAVKAGLDVAGPLGVGLRLSAEAAATLQTPAALDALRGLLDAHGLYVFTINGFPYGRFHGAPVKAAVYLPDWTEPERASYTDDLAAVLVAVLPDGVTGSISTVPGGFEVPPARVEALASALVDQAARLWGLAERTGKTVTLALEPEPCCFLETIDQAVRFFTEHLFGPSAVRRFAAATGLHRSDAAVMLRRHLGLCLDTCHAAVEFESASGTLAALAGAGITIAKAQLSSGLRVPQMNAAAAAALADFAEDTYLHQVVEQRAGTLARWLDLPEALAAWDGSAVEWRVHFHVPIFVETLPAFSTTSGFLRALLQAGLPTEHLEVETYTFDVLPPELRAGGVVELITRELAWARSRLLDGR